MTVTCRVILESVQPRLVVVTKLVAACNWKPDGWHPSGASLGGPVAATPNGFMWVGDGGAKLGEAGKVEASTDGGSTWTAGTGLPTDQSVDALAEQSDTGRIFAYCFGGDLYTSSDGGKTWGFLSSSLRSQ